MFCATRALCSGPAFFRNLAAAADRQGIGRDLAGDAGSGSDVGSTADRNGSDERGIAADEDAFTDDGLVLVDAVVVASDDTRANIGGGAYLSVTDVAQVVRFSASAQLCFLGFYEVSNVSFRADFAAGPASDRRAYGTVEFGSKRAGSRGVRKGSWQFARERPRRDQERRLSDG